MFRIQVGERLASLDSLRGVAALIVFLSHFAGMTADHTNVSGWWDRLELVTIFAGSLGTNLLLLMSGLLIGWSLAKPEFEYRSFLTKRMVRIYVPYVAVLWVAMTAWGFFPVLAKNMGDETAIEYFFHQLILIPGLFPSRPALTVSWTLSYIIAGYVLLPLFAIILRRVTGHRGSLLWLWVACVAGTLAANYVLGSPLIRVCYIPAGCMLAEMAMKLRSMVIQKRKMLVGASGALLLIYCRFLLWNYRAELGLGESAFSLMFFLCGLGAVSTVTLIFIAAGGAWTNSFNNPVAALLQFIGKRGYSFYLLHGAATKVLVLAVVGSIPGYLNSEIFTFSLMVVCLAATMVMSHFSFLLLEQQGPILVTVALGEGRRVSGT